MLPEARGHHRAPLDAEGAAGAAAEGGRSGGRGGVGVAAGDAGGLEERDGEEGTTVTFGR